MAWRRFTRTQINGVAAALLVSLIGAGFSAHALAPDAARSDPKPKPVGYEAEDHFPGAAYYTAVQDEAPAPVAGATGTIALPDQPVPENAVLDSSIQPARPFRLAGTPLDKARALDCLTTAIYYEAAREPDDGQRAVAQVILNRVRHPAFPATVCGTVYQGSERQGCQFSFACDGALARGLPNRQAWARATRVAAAALAGEVFAPVGMATHYHTYAVTPAWNRSLVMTGAFGAHFFHRWKGWWGTAAAFNQLYAGHEPVPGPHAPLFPEVPQLAALPAPTVAQPVPTPAVAPTPSPAVVAPARSIQAPYVESGQPRAAYAEDSPESQVLDRWKDSGKPIR